mmetsp:Transcript_6411/g.11888  ORF Transcript_6411/g.11888 Transcript_6411/m.11888 type:complete len:250 (+) Transcript_6411:824-1573(+)
MEAVEELLGILGHVVHWHEFMCLSMFFQNVVQVNFDVFKNEVVVRQAMNVNGMELRNVRMYKIFEETNLTKNLCWDTIAQISPIKVHVFDGNDFVCLPVFCLVDSAIHTAANFLELFIPPLKVCNAACRVELRGGSPPCLLGHTCILGHMPRNQCFNSCLPPSSFTLLSFCCVNLCWWIWVVNLSNELTSSISLCWQPGCALGGMKEEGMSPRFPQLHAPVRIYVQQTADQVNPSLSEFWPLAQNRYEV